MVGSHPKVEIVAKENKVTILDHESGTVTEKFVEDPMTIPRSLSEGWRPQLVEELPDAFCGENLASLIRNIYQGKYFYVPVAPCKLNAL